MATDATGSPTALGIPKYDTSVDAPSGLGFNAAMDVLDTLITAANKTVVKHAGTAVGTRRGLNFIEGANITLTVADDAANDKVDVTITAASTGDPAVGGDLSGTASNAQIVADAVGTTEIAANAVTSSELADGAVDTAALQDGAVTMAKQAIKVQSGAVSGVSGSGISVTFPVAFATTPIVVMTVDGGVGSGGDGSMPVVASRSTTGFTFNETAGGTRAYCWVAVGT